MAKSRREKKTKYSLCEKRAYYTGLGVGLTGQYGSGLTNSAVRLMSDKERESYMKGFEKGLDNVTVKSGIRYKNKWF